MADVSAYDPVFEAAGNEWNVDPQLLKAMAIQESGGRANAVSKAGAVGVMQIMPDTAKTLGITDPTDPVQSIYGAAKYMNRALDKEGSVEDALRNYHGGDGWRQAYGPESRGYVPAVTKHYQILGQFKAALADPDPSVTTDAAPATTPAPATPTGAGKAMPAPDYSDFLKRTGATADDAPSAAAGHEDFLTRTGAAPPSTVTTTTQEAPAGAPPSTDDMFPSGTPQGADVPQWMMQAPPSLEDVRSKIQQGETSILNALRPGPDAGMPEQVLRTAAAVGVHGLSGLAQLPVNALIGLREGPSGGVTWNPNTGTYGLTPEAASVVPFATGIGGRDIRFTPRGGSPLEFVPPARSGGPLPPDTAANLLSPDARARATEPPAGPTTSTGVPVTPPAPVAAPPVAVPPQPIPNNLTPAQVAEFRNIPEALPPAAKPIATQADAAARADQIINHFASIGNKEPIPGAEGALPTITGNSGLATLYRAVRDSDTPVPFTTLENASKAKAMSTLEDMGATTSQASQDRLAAAIENRAKTTAPMYKQAFDNKTSADTTGSTQMVEDLLKSKAKQNDNLRPELEAIQKKLAGETDPEQLKGIVDNIDTTMDRLGTEGKGDRETRRVMSAVKDQLISEIGPAAPGFDAAQATYSRLSRDVDRMKYFQGRKLTDLQGNPTLGNMRSMLDDIRKKQAGDKFHPADSVTPEDVKTIQGIHDQMQREQFTATAGKALGSNTFQNLATNAQVGRLGGHMSNALLGAGAAGVDMLYGGSGLGGAIVGNVLAEGGKYVRGRMAATAEATAERGRAMLMQELRDRLLNIDNKGVDALNKANQRPSIPR